VAAAEGFRHGLGDFRFRFDHAGAHAGDRRHVLLLLRDGHCAAFLSLCLRDTLIRLSLVGLKLCADIAANVHVAMSDGEISNACRRRGPYRHGAGDTVRVLQNVLVAPAGTDGGDDALAIRAMIVSSPAPPTDGRCSRGR
jgi:hypothetical protein